MDAASFGMDVVIAASEPTESSMLPAIVRPVLRLRVLLDTHILMGTEEPSIEMLNVLRAATDIIGSAGLVLDYEYNAVAIENCIKRSVSPDFLADPYWGWRFMHMLHVITSCIAPAMLFNDDPLIDRERDYVIDEVFMHSCSPQKTTLIYVLKPLF